MQGNVIHWCRDHYTRQFSSTSVTDPLNETGNGRVTRGSNYMTWRELCRPTSRFDERPDRRYKGIGFRVVMNVPSGNP